MKRIVLTVSLATSLLLSSFVQANDASVASSPARKIDTITVVSQGDPANYEVYSLKHTKAALQESVELMVDTISDRVISREGDNFAIAASAGSAI